MLDTLFAGWRAQFGAGLPVLLIQLPGFGDLASGPVESGWARLREAQRRAAERDPRTALVVTIDLGDRFDIHPPNKQAVARRAVRAARSLLLDADVSASGARPLQAVREDGTVTVRFAETGGGLVVTGDARPAAFELCDADGACRFADLAEIAGDTVRLGPAGAAERVRFCWADAPICNLYDATGYPVTPFELPVE